MRLGRSDALQLALVALPFLGIPIRAVCKSLPGGIPYGSELCWNLGDAVIRRRFVLACR